MSEALQALSRIRSLLDPNSFVEMGSQITARSTDFNLSAADAPSDGVIIGHGLLEGRLVFVYAQDGAVLNGTVGEMHAKKIKTVYEMAARLGAPVVGMIDSAGVRLQESLDALESIASLYRIIAGARGIVPQVLGVFGKCGGGLSALCGMSDFSFMAEGGRLFVNSPDALKDSYKEKCDTASAEFQYRAGNVDFIGTEEEIITKMRELLAILPGSDREGCRLSDCTDDLNRLTEGMDEKRNDISAFAAEISDDNVFVPVCTGAAADLTCGFIRLNGMTVGVIGNDAQGNAKEAPALSTNACKKAARHLGFCNAFSLPVLSLVNVSGYAATVEEETELYGAMSDLATAWAVSGVPKVTLLLKEAFGTSYLFMNTKSLGADLVYSYEDVDLGIMKPQLAAKIMTQDLPGDERMIAADFKNRTSGAGNAARRGYVDRIIDFADTRRYLIDAFELLYSKI